METEEPWWTTGGLSLHAQVTSGFGIAPNPGFFCRQNRRSSRRAERPWFLYEQNAHRRSRRKALALLGQHPGLGIAREDAEQVRALVGHQHPALCGVQRKVARDLTAAIAAADGAQGATLRIGRKAVDKIIDASGKVDRLSIPGDHRVAGAGGAVVIRREQLDAFDEGQAPVAL